MKKKQNILEVPYGETKVLLHTCCAPCSSAIVECLMNHGIEPVIFYSNPNIYPEEEYRIRKNECTRYAEKLGLTIIDDDYDHASWLASIKGLEEEPERGGRCLKCFKYRLFRAAGYARANGLKVLTTTLASSRWKSLDQINEAGRWACARANGVSPEICQDGAELAPVPPAVVWWEQNWRKGGLQERRNQIIREMDFYNQQYCGCEFSMRKDNLKQE